MSERVTTFSDDRIYRYMLWREWDFPRVNPMEVALGFDAFKKLKTSDDYAMFIGLNPSTADETKDDPTIRKCIGFAKRWGFGALVMTNLFAFRATDPKVMKKHPNPVGLHNHHHLLQCASKAGIIIAAWGKHGSHMQQDLTVQQWMNSIGATLHCLKKNGDGSPMHPLYVPYESPPTLFV